MHETNMLTDWHSIDRTILFSKPMPQWTPNTYFLLACRISPFLFSHNASKPAGGSSQPRSGHEGEDSPMAKLKYPAEKYQLMVEYGCRDRAHHHLSTAEADMFSASSCSHPFPCDRGLSQQNAEMGDYRPRAAARRRSRDPTPSACPPSVWPRESARK